jgi:hypothetical protein
VHSSHNTAQLPGHDRHAHPRAASIAGLCRSGRTGASGRACRCLPRRVQLMSGVSDGSGKQKRRTRCSHCGLVGHGKLNCPSLEVPVRGTVQCSTCGEHGHNSRSCRSRVSRVTCSLCGEGGHNHRTCPQVVTKQARSDTQGAQPRDAGSSQPGSVNLTDTSAQRWHLRSNHDAVGAGAVLAPPGRGSAMASHAQLAPPKVPAALSARRSTHLRASSRDVAAAAQSGPAATMAAAQSPAPAPEGVSVVSGIPKERGGDDLFGSSKRGCATSEDPHHLGPVNPDSVFELPSSVEDAVQMAAAAAYRCGAPTALILTAQSCERARCLPSTCAARFE